MLHWGFDFPVSEQSRRQRGNSKAIFRRVGLKSAALRFSICYNGITVALRGNGLVTAQAGVG